MDIALNMIKILKKYLKVNIKMIRKMEKEQNIVVEIKYLKVNMKMTLEMEKEYYMNISIINL